MRKRKGTKKFVAAALIAAMVMSGTGVRPMYAAEANPGVTEEKKEEPQKPAEGEAAVIPDGEAESNRPDGGTEAEKPENGLGEGQPGDGTEKPDSKPGEGQPGDGTETEQPDSKPGEGQPNGVPEEVPGDDNKEGTEIKEEIILEKELDGEIAGALAEEIAGDMVMEEELDYILGRPMTDAEKEEQKRLLREYVSRLVPLEADETVESVLDADEPLARAGALASSYDARSAGCVTSVKNQAPYGTCWTFSTMNSAESSLIKQGLASVNSVDLSERHLAYYAYNSVTDPLGGTEDDSNSFSGSMSALMNNGGNYTRAARILSMWIGAVNESTAPYSEVNTALPDTQAGAYGNNAAILKNVYGINKSDSSLVKQAIMDYGAVGIMYCALESDDLYYNYDTAAQYCNEPYQVNHAVSVVGWDDNYSRDNFVTKPNGNGAWLVKNSWGTNVMNAGYFWLSYEDATINDSFYVFEMQQSGIYDNNYQYDGSSADAYLLIGSSLQMANVFTAHANEGKKESLKAVAFASGSANCNYSIQIYKNPADIKNPASGTAMLSSPQTGQAAYEGYYTVPLKQEISLSDGDCFAVVVSLSKASGDIKLMLESTGAYSESYSSASAAVGQSFFRTSASGSWTDAGENYGRNIRVKAFTSNVNESSDGIAVTGIVMKETSGTVNCEGTKQLTAEIIPPDATNKMITWSSSDKSIATVDANGLVTGRKKGNVVITASAASGKYKAECKITVVEGYNSIKISGYSTLSVVGNTYQFFATINPSTAPDKTVTWSSSDPSVVKIDKNGKATAMGIGNAVIKAVANGDKSVVSTVNVSVPSNQNNQVRSFVVRMYTNVLNRDPEKAGLDDWSNRLISKTADGAAIAQGFIGSEEFSNRNVGNGSYLEILYKTFFNRNADASGKKYWMNLLENGVSREYVLKGFVNSEEFQKLCDSYHIKRGEMELSAYRDQNEGLTMFVNRLYVKALGRPGEDTGIEDWTGRILRGKETPESTAKNFFRSQEFTNKKLDDTEYVKVLYRTFMDREYDQAGLDDWVRKLAKGTSREKVLEGFSKSQEFSNIMKSYGLN